MALSFIEQKDNQVIAKQKLQVIVSKEMFEDGLAEIIDTDVQTLGFFIFRVLDPKSPTKYKDYQVNLPIVVKINAFKVDQDAKNYYVEFEPGDIIIENTQYFKRVDTVNKFLNYLIAAKINVKNPEDLILLFQQNAAMNDTRIAAQPAIVEALTAELVRWIEDETVPLRLALKKPGVKPEDFMLISIKNISRVTSVFNGVSFEDINKSLQAAVVMSRGNKEQIESPVEQILKY
jgi:hypothetical protein